MARDKIFRVRLTQPSLGQIGERCSKKRNFVSPIDKRLHQATIDPRDWQFFNHPTPSQSEGLNQSGMSSSLPAPYTYH